MIFAHFLSTKDDDPIIMAKDYNGTLKIITNQHRWFPDRIQLRNKSKLQCLMPLTIKKVPTSDKL